MSEFGTLNLGDMQAEDNRVNADQQSSFLDQFVPMPKPKPGQTAIITVRILPPQKGKKLFEYTRIHTMPTNQHKVHDPKRLVDGKWDRTTPNPILDYYNSLWREADNLEKAGRRAEAERCKSEARSIKPVERYYYNAIVRKITDSEGNVQTNVGPRILSVGKTLHKMIVRAIVGDEAEEALGDVTHPQTGYDFNIKVEVRGTGDESYPNYDRSSFARDPSPLGTPEEIQKWADSLYDLTKLHIPASYETMEKELAIHRGLIEDDNQGFSTEKFDDNIKKKYGKEATAEVVNVVDGAPDAVVENVEVVEDVSIEDEEFLRQMQALESNDE